MFHATGRLNAESHPDCDPSGFEFVSWPATNETLADIEADFNSLVPLVVGLHWLRPHERVDAFRDWARTRCPLQINMPVERTPQ